MAAILIDCLGTLVRLSPPGPRLRTALRNRAGVEVDEAAARAAFAAEIDYYIEHHLEGRDPASLDALRDRCAGVIAESLGLGGNGASGVRAAMLAALDFIPYPDAAPALVELRAAGLRVVVASNWDCSLHEVLERVGMRYLVDAVVPSARVGAPKPEPPLFVAALAEARCEPSEAIFVGDSPERDVAGARAAGIRAALVARDGPPPPGLPADVPVIRGLGEIASLT